MSQGDGGVASSFQQSTATTSLATNFDSSATTVIQDRWPSRILISLTAKDAHKNLITSNVEQEEWAGRLDFSAHGVGGFHKVPPNVPPIYSDRGERLRTVGAEFISKSGLRSEFPPAPSFYPKIACSTFPKSK